MQLNRVLVVVKPDASPLAHLNGRKLRRLAAQSALASVAHTLDVMEIEYHVSLRDRICRTEDFDLIIPVGGDGTFLAAAHAAGSTPLLGVNPSPENSIGFFCRATLRDFGKVLEHVTAGKEQLLTLPLIETRIDGKAMECLALNDVLFAGSSPAETVRCRIKIGVREEFQKSSGIWIAAGPGSTAAIHSAGGNKQPLTSNRLQYRVREPYQPSKGRYRLTHGLLPRHGRIRITSLMKGSALYLDGHWHSYAVAMGSTVELRIAKQTLSVFL